MYILAPAFRHFAFVFLVKYPRYFAPYISRAVIFFVYAKLDAEREGGGAGNLSFEVRKT